MGRFVSLFSSRMGTPSLGVRESQLPRNMERDGLCESEWETPKGGPARRVYSITDAGEAYLGFWAEALEQYRRNMDAFFSLYTGSKPPARKDRQEDDG